MLKRSLISVAVAFALTACGGSSSNNNPDPTPPTNNAPTDISLSVSAIDENLAGATIGDLSATDADASDSHTFTVSDDRFVISGAALSLAEGVSLDFEKESSVSVTVTATDSAGAAFSKELTVSVNDTHIVVSELPNTYNVADSVSYSGQVARHLLINELNDYINSGLQADLDNGTITTRDEALSVLMSYFSGDYETEVADRALTTSTILDKKQGTLREVSSSSKDLVGKIAGNDATGQHKDWSADFVAFGDKGTRSPQQEIERLLGLIADNAGELIAGNTRQDALGNDITKVYLGENGLDYKQLVQKILLGSVAFSQGADDYLDDDTENKGLLTDHSAVVDGKLYTNLEHQFDEGFGYFGAARDYLAYTDDEVAKKGGRDEYQGMFDTDSDGMIDFTSEFNFGHSQNAAKRDRGTASGAAPTDLSNDAMVAFIAGRKLLADTAGTPLDASQMLELQGFRDTALMAWEKSIAATAVHYVNDTLGDYDNFGTDTFSYSDLAKHWSELKGFVVSLQFNRRSPLTDEQHEQVNTLIKDAPVLTADDLDAYKADLVTARDILRDAYEFDAENAANW
jgi:plastocyanin